MGMSDGVGCNFAPWLNPVIPTFRGSVSPSAAKRSRPPNIEERLPSFISNFLEGLLRFPTM